MWRKICAWTRYLHGSHSGEEGGCHIRLHSAPAQTLGSACRVSGACGITLSALDGQSKWGPCSMSQGDSRDCLCLRRHQQQQFCLLPAILPYSFWSLIKSKPFSKELTNQHQTGNCSLQQLRTGELTEQYWRCFSDFKPFPWTALILLDHFCAVFWTLLLSAPLHQHILSVWEPSYYV